MALLLNQAKQLADNTWRAFRFGTEWGKWQPNDGAQHNLTPCAKASRRFYVIGAPDGVLEAKVVDLLDRVRHSVRLHSSSVDIGRSNQGGLTGRTGLLRASMRGCKLVNSLLPFWQLRW